MLEGVSALRGLEPPDEVVLRAQGLVPRTSWVRQAIEAVRAALVLDSAVPALAAVRNGSALPAAERYLRFEAAGFSAALHALPASGGAFDVEGQLLAPEGQAPFVVIAHAAGGKSVPGLSDENGHFRFPELPAGRFELHVELDDLDLLLGPLVLPGPEAEAAETAT